MSEKKEKKKPIFEKVGLVIRNPKRVDIVRELSTNSQRPIDLANKLEVDRQNINYHLGALKRGGIIKTQKMEVSQEDALKFKGAIVNKLTKEGKLKISYGVELTKNGKDVVKQFVDPLYEKVMVEENYKAKSVSKKKKEESKL